MHLQLLRSADISELDVLLRERFFYLQRVSAGLLYDLQQQRDVLQPHLTQWIPRCLL